MRIPLAKGGFTQVDEADQEWAKNYNWWKNDDGYAITSYQENYIKHTLLLHRVCNQTPEVLYTDHINRDRLDNRRSNLRTIDKSQNAHNTTAHKDSKSGIKGVSWNAEKKSWDSRIMIQGIVYNLGRYKKLGLAVRARKAAEKRYENGLYNG